MADTAYRSNANPLARWTRSEITDYAAEAAGLKFSSLSAQEQSVMLKALDAYHELARIQLPMQIQGFGEQSVDLTLDPDVNTRLEMPADFESLRSGGKIFRLDSDSNITDPVDVIDKQEWRESIQSGSSRHDSRLIFLAFLERLSVNNLRFICFEPTPTETIVFRVPYIGRVQILSSDSSILEAPVTVHLYLANKIAAALLRLKGNDRSQFFEAEANTIFAALSGANASETHRTVRFVPFDKAEKRGYQSANFPNT